MAHFRSQAWVTSVLNDDVVPNALVLANSLRRSKTTRQIVVIASRNISLHNRLALRKWFDTIISMDDTHVTGNFEIGKTSEAQAKAYVFGLISFEKCVFIPANAMILENCDKMFECAAQINSRVDQADGSLDLSIIIVKPERIMWEEIRKSCTGETSDNYLMNWIKETGKMNKTGSFPADMIADLSLTSGKLRSEHVFAPIIHFVDMKSPTLLDEFNILLETNLGLREKLIIKNWVELYDIIRSNKSLATMPLECFTGNYEREPIAIVGMSCRYPGANNLQEFWSMLLSGNEGICEPPSFRWTKEHTLRVTPEDRKSKAGFLSTRIDEFDARFFGLSPKEAAYLDPQTRILHEVLWESLEDAGINPQRLYGTHTGIFTGSWMSDYKDIVASSTDLEFIRAYMGSSMGAAAARLSFLLGLTGPSIATESGCSSAIVAVDLAVKSLRNGETNLAMAGAVNLIVHPFNSNLMEYVVSPDGRCKTFDANANGFGRAEGCGVLVLKRLSDALRSNDNIWAVIRGSAICQEGLSRSIGTPTVHCEALAMQRALEDANVAPERVSLVECHGTGTQVGDPMEVSAIGKAYHSRDRKEPLVIGSVKTNVGHTESCSGITGIMKSVLAMHHEIIPKHRNLETIHPEIFLESIPAIIPLENLPWPKIHEQPRICGVSSFGITGTNGHVILEEAPENQLSKFKLGMERPIHLITVSARTSEALDDLLKEYESRFSQNADVGVTVANLAYTANVGRAKFSYRAFALAHATNQLKVGNFVRGQVEEQNNPQVCFLFTGQGSQYTGMAKMLYETCPVFRINFDICDMKLHTDYGISIKNAMWDPAFSEQLSCTLYSQTSLFCVEYCLMKVWQSWGIQPTHVLGHSLGEFCAAVAAGILDFEDALKLVAERSRLIDNLPSGRMLVIKASQPEVEKFVKLAKVDVDIAAVNSAEQTVVAGDPQTVESFHAYLKTQNVKAVLLEATHAFHSRHMEPMLKPYEKVALTVTTKQGNPNIQYVSGLEGRVIEDSSELGADYWVRHTREKVSFVQACAAVKENGCTIFIEIGPQPVLSSFVMMNSNETPNVTCLPSLRRGQPEWDTMLHSLGKLFLLGHPIDWHSYDGPYSRRKVSLPFYPFHRKSFWMPDIIQRPIIIHPLLGKPFRNASALHLFENDLTLKAVPYLKDHCIGNLVVFPGAGYAEICLSAGYCVANSLSEAWEQPTRAMQLQNLKIEAPLELKSGSHCRLQVIVDLPEESETQGFRVKVFHQNSHSNKWVVHASAMYSSIANNPDRLEDVHRIPTVMSNGQVFSGEPFYKGMSEHGLKFAESFRMVQKFWKKPQENMDRDEVVTEVAIPTDCARYLLHPLLIDAAFQTGILTSLQDNASGKLQVPVRVGRLTMFAPIPAAADGKGSVYLHAKHDEQSICSVLISTPDWTPVGLVENVEIVETTVRTIESVLQLQAKEIPDAWEESWKLVSSPFKASLPVSVNIKSFRKEIETEEYVCQLYAKTDRLLCLYTIQALQDLGWVPEVGSRLTVNTLCAQLGTTASHLHKLVQFYLCHLEKRCTFLRRETGNTDCFEWQIVENLPARKALKEETEEILNNLKAVELLKPTTLIYEHVAKHLPALLQGKLSALSLLFPTDADKQQYSADTYYQTHPNRPLSENMVSSIAGTIVDESRELYAAQSQSNDGILRVLEVGAGTGSLSICVLKRLRESWGSRFEYYYTDVSQGFFVKAEKKLEEYRDQVKFSVFNIEQSPLSQGIPVEYFDAVCCTDVLHATRGLEEALVHIRQTLKPRGVFFFTETVLPVFDFTFVFGLLEGYWRFQDKNWRVDHCCISEQVWRKLLTKCGFGSTNSIISYMGQFACITTTADETCSVENLRAAANNLALTEEQQKSWILFTDIENCPSMTPVANMLLANSYKVMVVLRKDGKSDRIPGNLALNTEVKTTFLEADLEEANEMEGKLSECQNLQGVIYGWGMSFKEHDQRKLALPFLNLARLLINLQKPAQLFVLTRRVQVLGLPEKSELQLNPSAATLWGMAKSLKNEMDSMFVRCIDLDEGLSPRQVAAHILYELADSKKPRETRRIQVVHRNGKRYEPRLVEVLLPSLTRDYLPLPASTDRYKLKLPASRVINDLEFEPLEPTMSLVKDTEIEVQVKAFALNFRDILTILKPSADFESFNTVGLDLSGVVTKAGRDSGYVLGDRVFGANFKNGQLPSHLILESDCVLRMPNTMTFREAATIPAVYLTTFHCRLSVANMSKGDTVLIHTGSGGVGLAAIQLAKHCGATLVTTAGSHRKRTYLRNLGIEHVFHSRDTSFEQDILRVTNGRGVDIVLNSITGPGIKEATLRVTAQNARFVEMSKLNVWSVDEVKQLRPDVRYHLVDLTTLDRHTLLEHFKNLEYYLESGVVKPIPCVQFDAGFVRQALQYLREARHIGKVVVSMPQVNRQEGQLVAKCPLFNAESTYLITGGLGGIGFAVCKWMLGLGATHIVLMGRSPPKPEIAEEIQKLNEKANVIVRQGDVGNWHQI